jgi:hypothetical protein
MPISHHTDEVVAVTRGYGTAAKPEDFLNGFTAYVRENINSVAAVAEENCRGRMLGAHTLEDYPDRVSCRRHQDSSQGAAARCRDQSASARSTD